MFEIREISKSFGSNSVLRGVSFEITPGDIIGLIGPSGAGKSVLLKLLGKVIEPDAGEITYSPRNSSEVESGESDCSGGQTKTGFLFQEGALFDSMSVLENVAFPLLTIKSLHSGKSSRPSADYQQAMEQSYKILSEVGLAKAGHKLPGQLSGGMRRRVALARALVDSPQLVLLDDPTGGLDPVAASVIMKLISELHSHYNPTIVMVSHDLRRLLPGVSRVLALFDGELVCDQPVSLLAENATAEVLAFIKTRYDFGDDSRSQGSSGPTCETSH